MPGVGVEISGADKISKKFTDKDNINNPLWQGIRNITYKLEGEVKQATVVRTGRLRSSVHSEIREGQIAKVSTNVEYASYIEYGTDKMAARHMEGAVKVLGQGMFSYALERLSDRLGPEEKAIAKKLEMELT